MAKKPSEPYKLKMLFAEIWSMGYNGEKYEGGSRDLRSAKEYLELNIDFFEDEQSQMIFKERSQRYINDKYWYKPYGNPPMFHPMYCFINNIEKYANAVKNVTKKPEPKPMGYYCIKCQKNHLVDEICPKDAPTEEISSNVDDIRAILHNQFPKQ